MALVREGSPVVLPMAVARDGQDLLLHGSTGAGLLRAAATPAGSAVSVAVTHLDGLVLARSAFASSMNYRSAVVHGVAHLVPLEQRGQALRVLTEHATPGRWDEVRALTRREVAATAVLRLPLARASVKVRAQGVREDEQDEQDGQDGQDGEDVQVRAGVLPTAVVAGAPRTSALTRPGAAVPASLRRRAERMQDVPAIGCSTT